VRPRFAGNGEGSPRALLVVGEGGGGGYEGFAWSRPIVGEADAVPGDGVVEGVLRVLRLGSAMATCSA
jgi:hypothetical protein